MGANGIARFGGNIEEALAHIERALALSPNSAHVRRMSGYTCIVAGKHERSIEHFKRAMQLDPMDPWAFHSYYGIALPHFFTGRYEEALVWLDKALLDRPNLCQSASAQDSGIGHGRPSFRGNTKSDWAVAHGGAGAIDHGAHAASCAFSAGRP